jgi:hypothetical protein
MKIRYLSLLGLLLAFAACKKDDDNSNTPTTTKMYVSSVISHEMDSVIFDYNADKQVTRWARFYTGETNTYTTFIYFIRYENGKPATLDFTNYADGTTELKTVRYITYDGSKPVKIRPSTSLTGPYDSLTYNSKNQVTGIYSFNSIEDTNPATFILTWENDNVVKAVTTNQGSAYSNTYTYDNKPGIYAGLAYLTYNSHLNFQYYSANNLLTDTFDDGHGYTYTDNYTYEYNENGYPVKMKINTVFNDGSTPDVDSSRITYMP